MADTPAERQRRHKAHQRGDHSLCNPERCNPASVGPARVPDGGSRPPRRLRTRGLRLWRQLVDEAPVEPGPGELILIEEACRLADRLERLDAIVNGEDRSWLTLEYADDGIEVTVVVDKVLTEARQQQLTLKQIIGELRQAGRQASEGAGRARGRTPGSGVGPGVADLTKRIADRRRQASG